MSQFHEKEWKQLAARLHLNLKRVPGVSGIEYEYASTRTARLVWEERSILAERGDDCKAYYNAGLQHASEVAFRLHGAEAAKCIQELRK